MPRMTTGDSAIQSLLAHGIDTLFALPGVHNDHLFDAAHKASSRIPVIHPRQEQTAAYMALGAALFTGRPQTFAVVPGRKALWTSLARFYITSPVMLAHLMGPVVRSHWAVKNSLHWVMDMVFRDDECGVRTDHVPAHFTTIKHMAYKLL